MYPSDEGGYFRHRHGLKENGTTLDEGQLKSLGHAE